MMYLITKDDFNHVFSLNLLAIYKEPNHVNSTIEIELDGIKIAATIGFKLPLTAKLNPTMLYIIDRVKLHHIICRIPFAINKNLGNEGNLSAEIMASEPGVK